jgi:predicted nucleic acid-binding protein
MTVYWDSSAVVWFYSRGRIAEISGVTRPHTLSEVFSAMTGGGFDMVSKDGKHKHVRISIQAASAVLAKIAPALEFVELSGPETLKAIQSAANKGAQGGRIHDLMHAAAAEKANADELWTLDRNDFEGLGRVKLKYLSEDFTT